MFTKIKFFTKKGLTGNVSKVIIMSYFGNVTDNDTDNDTDNVSTQYSVWHLMKITIG